MNTFDAKRSASAYTAFGMPSMPERIRARSRAGQERRAACLAALVRTMDVRVRHGDRDRSRFLVVIVRSR
jgi:hypothetical protein